MPFLSQVAVRRIGLNRWQLLEDLCYRSLVDGRTYTAAAGFVTDWATVPRITESFVPREGLWDEPAVIHDLCCDDLARYHDELHRGHLHPRVPWRDARGTDQLWREMLRAGGVGPALALILWTAVRWGAVANPARRPGWWRDAPAVLAVTAAVLILALAVLLGLGVAVCSLLALT